MSIVIGIKLNGEQLRFEKWVYDAHMRGTLVDPVLKKSIGLCFAFRDPGVYFQRSTFDRISGKASD